MFFNGKNNDHSPQVVLFFSFLIFYYSYLIMNEPHILQETLGVFCS